MLWVFGVNPVSRSKKGTHTSCENDSPQVISIRSSTAKNSITADTDFEEESDEAYAEMEKKILFDVSVRDNAMPFMKKHILDMDTQADKTE